MSFGSSFSYLGSVCNLAYQAASYCLSSSPANANALEDRTEEFGLLVSLAAAKRLPEGSKPVRDNRIRWDQPNEVRPIDATTINSQGAKRRANNWLGMGVAEHSKIIPKWPNEIETALILHLPKNLLEQDPLIVQTKIDICKDAIETLDRLRKYTYVKKNDGTVDQLTLCIKILRDRLRKIESKRASFSPSASSIPAESKIAQTELSFPMEPLLNGNISAQIEPTEQKESAINANSPPQREKNEQASPSETKSAMPQEKEFVDVLEKATIKNEVRRLSLNSDDGRLSGSGLEAPKDANSRVALVAAEVTALWQDKCLFEILRLYFADLDSVPAADRATSKKFISTFEAIDSLLNQRGSLYKEILTKDQILDFTELSLV